MADPLERAWDAYSEGRLEDVLERLGDCATDDAARYQLECLVRVELADLAGARGALERAQALGADPAEVGQVQATAWLALYEWRVADARAALEALLADERTPEVLDRLALCLELEHDFAGADRLLAEAERLDPEVFPRPPRLSEGEFDAVVRRAIGRIEGPYAKALETTAVIVEAVPWRELLAGGDVAETPPDLLGLFVGPSELDGHESAEMPPTIFLFQRNIERASRDQDDLSEQIEVTLYHEFAHLLGFDEEGVDEIGLA